MAAVGFSGGGAGRLDTIWFPVAKIVNDFFVMLTGNGPVILCKVLLAMAI